MTVIERLQGFYGFTRMPFGRDLAPGMLHRHAGHAEAVARISWCVAEHALGVITGEVGAGKTVAVRAALAALDPTRHTIIYLPNPTVGVRGIHHAIVAALGGLPRTHIATLIPQTADALAVEHSRTRPHPRPGHRRSPPARPRPARRHPDAHQPRHGLRDPRSPACSSANPPCADGSNSACSPPSTNASPCATPWPRMTAAETASYLRHHLTLAGRSDTLFSDDATALIHQTSRGYPAPSTTSPSKPSSPRSPPTRAIVDESSTRAAVTEVTTE